MTTIIGGGPAGAAAALLLARRGWSVTLVEQHRFPREKVCGECLSAQGVEVLERMGLVAELVRAGAIWLTRAVLHGPAGGRVDTLLPRPMLGISRAVLDGLLLEAAREAGARVRQPARCEAIDADASGVRLRVRDLDCNRVETLDTPIAILADGKAALAGVAPPSTDDFGIKSHWAGVDGPRDAIELFGCDGCYGGLAAIEGNRWNAAFSVPARRLRLHRGDVQALFCELLEENSALARRLRRGSRIRPWLASPLPRFAVQEKWPANVIPLGNAAAALEPIGGEGMGLALRSAELAFAALDRSPGEWDERGASRLRREFKSLWNIRRVACRAMACGVSSALVAEPALEWLSNAAGFTRIALSLIGKA